MDIEKLSWMAAVIYSNSKELDLEESFYAQQEYLSVQGKKENQNLHTKEIIRNCYFWI